jgi:hypothetical protein
MNYFVLIKPGKMVLWCYLIWYSVTVLHHFDPSPKIWINALGISAVIGCGLLLSVATPSNKLDTWQTVRLFLMPFCVSSFSSLIKGQGFVLIFSTDFAELVIAVSSCLSFVVSVLAIKYWADRVNKNRTIL